MLIETVFLGWQRFRCSEIHIHRETIPEIPRPRPSIKWFKNYLVSLFADLHFVPFEAKRFWQPNRLRSTVLKYFCCCFHAHHLLMIYTSIYHFARKSTVPTLYSSTNHAELNHQEPHLCSTIQNGSHTQTPPCHIPNPDFPCPAVPQL